MSVAFPTTLKLTRRVWFNRLKTANIRLFEQPATTFVHNFATFMIRGKTIHYLRQNFGELIIDFFKRFTKEMIKAKNVDQATMIAAVTKAMKFGGLND